MSKNEPVVKFDKVLIKESGGDLLVNFSLYPGEVMTVLCDKHGLDAPLCDLANGLMDAESGKVEFMGRSWPSVSAFGQPDMRGRIGRVFEGEGLVSNVTVYGNIALAQRHHTRRKEDDIRAEADALAREAGIFPIPEGLPEQVTPVAALKKAEWVRAFMGRPQLVLIERPEQGTPEQDLGSLINMIVSATAAGTAVLCMTTSCDMFADKRLKSLRRFTIKDNRFTEEPGGKA